MMMMMLKTPIYCAMCVLTIFIIKEVQGNAVERKLREMVFSNYDKEVRPVEREEDAVNVTLDLEIFQIIKLNEKEQSLEVSAWLRQTWHDRQLSWDPKNFSGIKRFNVNPEKVWLPDTVLYNSVLEDNEVGGYLDRLSTRIVLKHTGEVRWFASAILKTHCDINVRHFPFDSQDCELRFVSWTNSKSQLALSSKGSSEMDTDDYEENSVWKLTDTSVQSKLKNFGCCDEPFTVVAFHVHLQRRSLFYVLNLVFPISVITLLTILSFLLPAESGERISLAVTLLLATTFIMLVVSDTVPATSQEVPLVSLYFIISMVDMIILMVTVCYVNRLHHKEPSDGAMSEWTRRIILNKLSYIVGIQRRPSVQRSDEEQKHLLVDANTTRHSEVTSLRDKTETEFTSNGDAKHHPSLHRRGTDTAEDGSNVNRDTKELAKMIQNIIDETLSHKLDKLVDKVEGMNEDESIKTNWRIVAMTVDRCLLIFFLINFIVTLIGVFSLSPGYVS